MHRGIPRNVLPLKRELCCVFLVFSWTGSTVYFRHFSLNYVRLCEHGVWLSEMKHQWKRLMHPTIVNLSPGLEDSFWTSVWCLWFMVLTAEPELLPWKIFLPYGITDNMYWSLWYHSILYTISVDRRLPIKTQTAKMPLALIREAQRMVLFPSLPLPSLCSMSSTLRDWIS